MDNRDFTNKYNTKLSPEEEIKFQNWLKNTSIEVGKDISRDLYDYDMRGAFKEGLTPDNKLHWKDTYKKPNHITFSDESKYHNVDNYIGGKWEKDNLGNFSFTPGKTNFYNQQELEKYFLEKEPGIKLNPTIDTQNKILNKLNKM